MCRHVCVCVRLVSSCHDESSRFLRLVAKPGRQFIEFDDFLPLIQVSLLQHLGFVLLLYHNIINCTFQCGIKMQGLRVNSYWMRVTGSHITFTHRPTNKQVKNNVQVERKHAATQKRNVQVSCPLPQQLPSC